VTFDEISLDFESEVISPEAVVSFGNGQKGKLHSMSDKVKFGQVADLVSFKVSSLGLTYSGHPIG